MPTFLTAEWRHLLMVNYAVEPDLLRGFLPNGIELDQWNGTTYLSVVGFLFLRTKILGVPIPQHTNFEEVNLRFYVKRLAPDGYRRGVVFIKEIVPRPLIALVARKCYNEPYQTMPMRHAIDEQNGNLQSGSSVEYAWKDERTGTRSVPLRSELRNSRQKVPKKNSLLSTTGATPPNQMAGPKNTASTTCPGKSGELQMLH